jgi:hypothetical protein
MRRNAAFLALLCAAGCGSSEEQAPPQNEATRLSEDLLRQSQRIQQQAAEGAVAVEREFENQTAIVFEKRGNPFNDSKDAAAGEANASR